MLLRLSKSKRARLCRAFENHGVLSSSHFLSGGAGASEFFLSGSRVSKKPNIRKPSSSQRNMTGFPDAAIRRNARLVMSVSLSARDLARTEWHYTLFPRKQKKKSGAARVETRPPICFLSSAFTCGTTLEDLGTSAQPRR